MKKFKQFIFSTFLLQILFPLSVFAAEKLNSPLDNPLNTTSITNILGRLISALLGLSGAAALLMFVWGGFLWLTSRGESAQITKGKDTLKWATIGLFVIFTAYLLVNAVISTLVSGDALNTKNGNSTPVGPQSVTCSPGSHPDGLKTDGSPICVPDAQGANTKTCAAGQTQIGVNGTGDPVCQP